MLRRIVTALVVVWLSAGVVYGAPTAHAETECATKVAAVSVKVAAESGADVNEGDCAGETSFSINGKTTGVSVWDLAIDLLRMASALTGILIVAGVVYGGIVYSSSKGNPAGIQKARTIIGNSLLALMLFLSLFAIINFLIPGRVLF